MKSKIIKTSLVLTFALFCGFQLYYHTGIVGMTKKANHIFIVPGCVCHDSSAATTVWIDGPDTLAAGELGLYTISVSRDSNIAAGFNVASFLGDLGIFDSAGTQMLRPEDDPEDSLELTHVLPKLAGGQDTISWSFYYRAPLTGGVIDTLYANANSVDTSQDPSGDGWNFAPNFLVHVTVASVNAPVLAGWNMLSVPMGVPDLRKTEVFPGAVSPAYAFTSSGYSPRDTLRYGEGYWLKYGGSETINLSGGLREVDAFDVNPGWNMIGSISYPVGVGTIQQIPPGIVASQYYSFNGSGYVSSDTIRPASSYWVKANQAGQLVLERP